MAVVFVCVCVCVLRGVGWGECVCFYMNECE